MLIIKVPAINGLGKTDGCEKAPNLIVKALKDIYSSESGKKIDFSVKEISIDNSNLELMNQKIQQESKNFFNNNKGGEKLLFLGGDHSISFNILKQFSKNKNIGLIVFDAHPDCMAPGREPNHEEWLRGMIEQGFDPKNIILVAIRNSDPEETAFLREKKINIFSMKELHENLESSCDKIMEKAKGFDSLYLSLDIDAIDPACAPGTGYIEPGGLSSREFLYMIQRISLLENLKIIDLVEVNSEKDVNEMTVKLAAKIIVELQ
jgi:arginase family enzyme